MNLSTKLIHGGMERNAHGTTTNPLYLCAAYEFPSAKSASDRFALKEGGNIYSRITNPSQSNFEAKVAQLYGVESALAVASGSAAVFYVIMTLCKAGDHIVANSNVYGGTFDLLKYTLPRMGVEVTMVKANDMSSLTSSIQDNTKLILCETMSNPSSYITDIQSYHKVAERAGIPLVVDNTFCGPTICNPFVYGADVVVESATKFYAGDGSVMGGLIVESKHTDWKDTYINQVEASYHGVNFYALGHAALTTKIRCCILRDTGACISPYNAWTLDLNTRTMGMRIAKQVENAIFLARMLKVCPGVKSVSHPCCTTDEGQSILYSDLFENGAGSIFSVEFDLSKEQTAKMIDLLRIWKCEANVGDSVSIINQPATTTHSQLTLGELASLGISGSTCRLSCGCEDANDLYNDIVSALKQVTDE